MTAVLVTPALSVEIDGTALRGAEAARLIGCRISQQDCAPDQAELDFAGIAPTGMVAGTSLRITVAGSPAPLFTGEVTAVEHDLGADGFLAVRIRGYDTLHRLRLSGSVRVWSDVTVADVASELASAVGLSVQSGDIGPTSPRAVQHGQSDLEFLTGLAARAGLGLHLRQDTLHLHALGEAIGPEIQLSWGSTLRSATIDHNPGAGPRPIQLQGQILGALGESDGSLDEHDDSGEGEALLRPGATVVGSEDAQALVRAERRRQEASAWVLRATASGDPRLRPGAGVRLSPPVAAPDLARSFVLTEVVHSFDDRAGFVSTLSSAPVERPANAVSGSTPTVSVATVTDVADPEGAGRILATLDAYDDIESAWLPVLTPAAGADSGLIVQPDVGARVLVLSSGLDPGAGVVIGVMFTGALPDDSVEGGHSRRQSWRTSGGQRIGLDDVAQTIIVADSPGSMVRLAPGLVTIESVGDLHLRAPGKAIVITAASVDFVEG